MTQEELLKVKLCIPSVGCIMREILPIELRGYPIRINQIGEKTEQARSGRFGSGPLLSPKIFSNSICDVVRFINIEVTICLGSYRRISYVSLRR